MVSLLERIGLRKKPRKFPEHPTLAHIRLIRHRAEEHLHRVKELEKEATELIKQGKM